MLAKRHIWKQRLGRLLALGAFSLILSLLPGSVHAAGETYKWAKAGDYTTLSASGGSYDKATTFTRQNETNGATYTGKASYVCNGQTKTSNFTIKIDQDYYNGGKPIDPAIAKLDPGTTCADLKWDTDITVANSTGVEPNATDTPGTTTSECNQGKMGWLFCPVIDNLSGAITKLANEGLVPLLKVKAVSPEDTPGIYHVWERMRDLADVLFILVFLIIIYATLTAQDIPFLDAYTVRKTWLKLVIAVILVQGSFLISRFLVDVGNVMGGGIASLINVVAQPSSGGGSVTNVLANLTTDLAAFTAAGAAGAVVLASWTVAFPVLLSLMLSLLAVFFTLGARYLIISILIAGSPLVMVAWTLPGTRNYLGDWFELFFRLIIMYPMIIGLLALASILNELISFSGGTADSGISQVATMLVKPLIVVAIFLAIPAMFKLAGTVLTRAHGFFSGLTNRGQGLLKGSEFYQRGQEERKRRQNTYMGRVLNSDTLKSLSGSKNGLARAAGSTIGFGAGVALLGAPKNLEALQRSNSALVSRTRKEIGELKEGKNPKYLMDALQSVAQPDLKDKNGLTAHDRLSRKAPSLLRYASTAAGREAILETLYDTDFAGKQELSQFLEATPKKGLGRLGTKGNVASEFIALRDAGQFKRNLLPSIAHRLDHDEEKYEVKDRSGQVIRTEIRKVGDMDITEIGKSWSKATASTIADKMSPDNFDVITDIGNTKVSAQRQKAAHDAAEGFFIGIDHRVLGKVFDINSRNPASMEKKLAIIDAMHSASNDFRPTNETVYKTIQKEIHQDEKLTYNILRKTEAREDQIASLSNAARTYVVHRYLEDRSFKYGDIVGQDIEDLAAQHLQRNPLP